MQVQKDEKRIDTDVSKSPEEEANAFSPKAETTAINPTKRISKKSNQFISAKPARSFASNPTNHFSARPEKDIAFSNESTNEELNDIRLPGEFIAIPWFEDISTPKHLHSKTLNACRALTLPLKKRSIKKHKWTKGFTLSGGSSWIENKATLASATAYFNSGSYVTNSYGPGYFYYPSGPSFFTNSFSFAAGVFAERNLSQKLNLSLGISYSHLSLQNNVSNNFEFVQLPVLIHLQINRNDHLPLTLDAGVTASKLAGSDAQQYNYSSNRWYHDNHLFNQFQANLHAGFSFAVFNKHDKQIRVGPAFSYGLTQMANNGIYAGRHLHVLDLCAEMLFGKK